MARPRALLVAAALGIAPLGGAGAQRVLGPGDDAFVLPRGALRIGASIDWGHFDERYGPKGLIEPLGRLLSRDSLTSADIATLAPTERALRALLGQSSLALSLGTVHTSLDRSRVITPIRVEYGLTSRITLSAMVPYVRTRTDVGLAVNPRGASTANAGPNPSLLAISSASVRAQNAAVTTALRSAATALQQQVTACQSTPTTGSCPTILASAQQVAALIASANSTADAISNIYGDAEGKGAPFVPLRGSTVQSALEDRLKQMNAAFRSFLGSDLVTRAPVPAPVPITVTDFQALLGDSATGILASPLATVMRGHIGDVEVGATFLAYDGFGRDERRRTEPAGLNGRVAVGALVRLPTGQRDSPEDLADLGTGDRQTDIEGRVAADVMAGGRFWVSLVGLYGVQFADRVPVRVPTAFGLPFTLASRELDVDRKLGNYFDIQATPRWALGDYFALAAQWRFRAKAADTYSAPATVTGPGGAPSPLDASILGLETDQREQRIGFGATYSTLAAFDRGRSRVPLEVSFLRTIVVTGRNTPALADASVRLRIYTRMKRPANTRVAAPRSGGGR